MVNTVVYASLSFNCFCTSLTTEGPDSQSTCMISASRSVNDIFIGLTTTLIVRVGAAEELVNDTAGPVSDIHRDPAWADTSVAKTAGLVPENSALMSMSPPSMSDRSESVKGGSGAI